DWDLLFQLLFNELLTPPSSVDTQAPEVIALIADVIPPVQAESISLPSSTTVDQDATLPNIEVAHMGDDPLFGVPILEATFAQSSSMTFPHSIVQPDHQIPQHNSKWMNDHPQQNIIEPKTYKEALTQSCWIEAMQEELNEFKRLEVWELVPRPDKVTVITLKLETIRIFLAYAAHKNMVVYQMDAKTAFLNGLQISQSPRGIFINQSKYALESLKKYGFEFCDPVDTPMVEKSKLYEDKEGKAVDPSHYRGMIGTLLYLTASRPDLQFAICMYARYQARPTKKHDSSVALTAFADADHAGCQDIHRSTSGSLQFLGDRLISWSSKRQKSAAISSTEAEYIALLGCCAQILWMRSQLTDYGPGF
nr:uncharacterized mitochondrial protein AtMg00810-like [Tanacetum cinerariifolium]